jgi:hypothetical protein
MLDEKGMCFLMVNRMTETVRMRHAAKINNLIYISNFKINFKESNTHRTMTHEMIDTSVLNQPKTTHGRDLWTEI